MEKKSPRRSFNRQSQSGMSLLETMIAVAVLLIVTAGIMSMAMVATSTTENQGHLAARATEYAQDKMEQLISLAYGDGDPPAPSGSDTTVFPSTNTGGTGLAIGGRLCGLPGQRRESPLSCRRSGAGYLVLHPCMADFNPRRHNQSEADHGL